MEMLSMTEFTLRLRAGVEAKKFRYGYPWIYSNDIISDRRSKALIPGSFCKLVDYEKNPICLVTVNPNSKIFARIMDFNLQAIIDATWIKDKIMKALSLRTEIFRDPFYRLINAEADGLPGLIADRFNKVVVMQPNAFWTENMCKVIASSIKEVCEIDVVIKNAAGRSRRLEGLDDKNSVFFGNIPEGAISVPMNGAIYKADVISGQKTGLFYDQRQNHKFVASLADGKAVLDVFCHVGGFGLAAIAAGASNVSFVDSSASALELVGLAAAEMKKSENINTIRGDAFAVMKELANSDHLYDIVICDPPAFVTSRNSLQSGLRAYEKMAKLASSLIRENGVLVLCSCSQLADLIKFRNACVRGIGRGGRRGKLIYTGFAAADHPMHLQLLDNSYLKSLVFRL
jgi:23S rRNA (cytosine1962-C5)-methyltransferase